MGSFSLWHWLIVGAFFYLIYKAFSGGSGKIDPAGAKVCPTCGTRGNPKTVTRGSIWIEIILWICFIVPGVIYSIWRLTTRREACPACGAPGMIPVSSPVGQKLVS